MPPFTDIALRQSARKLKLKLQAVISIVFILCLGAASTPAQIFPASLLPDMSLPLHFEKLFNKKHKLFGQKPILKLKSEDLIFRVTAVPGRGVFHDSWVQIDIGADQLSAINFHYLETKKCPDGQFTYGRVRKSFKIRTTLLSGLRRIIDRDKLGSSPMFDEIRGRDGAEFLFEIRWPSGVTRSFVRWSPEDPIFGQLIAHMNELLVSKASLAPNAVKAREGMRPCP